MSKSSKVAIITGGASGMGLAVAENLAGQTSANWTPHLFDMNAAAGAEAVPSEGNPAWA